MPRRKRRKTVSPTILDYLNEDCWRCVLDYVDLKQVIFSERVSQQWQAVVLRYMQTVRLAVENPGMSRPTMRAEMPWPKVRWLKLHDEDEDWSSFEHWTKKLGSTVVVAYCSIYESRLKILINNCPNMEALMIVGFDEPISHNITSERLQRLKRLCFRYSFSLTDQCVSQLINSSITELDVHGNEEDSDEDDIMEGKFLKSVKSKLTSLTLVDIELWWYYLGSTVDWLSELKSLHLAILPQIIFENIHVVLEKTPKLEHLHLDIHTRRKLDLSKHVCRLVNLRHLSGNSVWTDEHLEAVILGCKELRSLEIQCESEVSVRGLQVMARHAGARLVTLNLGYNDTLTEDDLVVCFRGCVKLTKLDVNGCKKFSISSRLPQVAEQARRGLIPRPPPLVIRAYTREWTIE